MKLVRARPAQARSPVQPPGEVISGLPTSGYAEGVAGGAWFHRGWGRACGKVAAGLTVVLAAVPAAQCQALDPAQAAPAGSATSPLPPVPLPATGTTGTLSGTVTDAHGALVGGAQVDLQSAGAPSRTVVSDRDGRFAIENVAPGSFQLMIHLPGFDPVAVSGTLQPHQRRTLEVPALQMATLSVSVDAVASAEELSTEQMQTEEHQRLLGVLPNFFVSYNWNAPPLTAREKFTLATKNAFDPGNLALVGTVAGVQQATNAFPGYHQGAAGYGKRYGADLANLFVGTYMGGAILPSLFHQDPRYFYKGTGTLRSRFFYAVSTAVICRGDNGKRQPAFASVLGDLSAGAISNLYYAPADRQGATLTFENGLLGIAGDAMNNVFQEFVLKKLTSKDH